ncbi:endonuclease/exonuclease/phosphatase family protein [Sphingomonas solaris]|uniref:Endonuclease n=1 Tax=Alterirhizorhabdus solaris TaxID=2529389 RepID=A0A558R324_9SPHN|nr:endonuclease/exonuclease/phosphatase family protein [Sphingomonas solaris]TVV73784.1 endonuclease [Sphingomonas solaris]
MLVASYNIHKAVGSDRRHRPDRILDVLREVDADIVALQEADRRFGTRLSALPLNMIAEHSDYCPVPFDIRPGGIGWHGNALLVRKSATILHRAPLVLPALEPRGAVMADIRLNGREIRIVGMHLDLSGLWRRRQANAVMMHIEQQPRPLPTVMMGDMNEWRRHGGCLGDFAQHYAFAETGPSFHARQPIARLDRIVVSQDLRVAETGVHRSASARTASDHLPVWARLDFG